MDLSIIIVTRNRPNLLGRALKSCVQITKIKYEIIVIDQVEDPEVADACEVYNANYYHKETTSLSVSRNFGIELAKGHWLLFLDDDAILSTAGIKFLTSQLNYFENSIICANVRCIEDINESFIPRHKNLNTSILNFNLIVQMLSCGLLVPKDIIKKHKFDVMFGVGATYGSGEETDLLIRMSKLNKIIFHEDWIVLHPREQQITPYSKLFKRYYSYGKGTGAVIAKHLSLYTSSTLFFYFGVPIIRCLVNAILIKPKQSNKIIAMFLGRVTGFIQYKLENY